MLTDGGTRWPKHFFYQIFKNLRLMDKLRVVKLFWTFIYTNINKRGIITGLLTSSCDFLWA